MDQIYMDSHVTSNTSPESLLCHFTSAILSSFVASTLLCILFYQFVCDASNSYYWYMGSLCRFECLKKSKEWRIKHERWCSRRLEREWVIRGVSSLQPSEVQHFCPFRVLFKILLSCVHVVLKFGLIYL
jgi:hypothetical protein